MTSRAAWIVSRPEWMDCSLLIPFLPLSLLLRLRRHLARHGGEGGLRPGQRGHRDLEDVLGHAGEVAQPTGELDLIRLPPLLRLLLDVLDRISHFFLIDIRVFGSHLDGSVDLGKRTGERLVIAAALLYVGVCTATNRDPRATHIADVDFVAADVIAAGLRDVATSLDGIASRLDHGVVAAGGNRAVADRPADANSAGTTDRLPEGPLAAR